MNTFTTLQEDNTSDSIVFVPKLTQHFLVYGDIYYINLLYYIFGVVRIIKGLWAEIIHQPWLSHLMNADSAERQVGGVVDPCDPNQRVQKVMRAVI